MRITARTDYAARAMIELAAVEPDALLKAETIAERQDIPKRFLLNILHDLRVAKLVDSRRGNVGGYGLARPASEIAIADIIRAVEGPLADVHGMPPESLDYPEPATALRDVWLATRVAVREVLEKATLADIVGGQLPAHIQRDLTDPDALERR